MDKGSGKRPRRSVNIPLFLFPGRLQNGPQTAQGCSKTSQDGSREAQVDPRGVHVSPGKLQDDSRRLQAVPGSSQDVPKDTSEETRGGKK